MGRDSQSGENGGGEDLHGFHGVLLIGCEQAGLPVTRAYSHQRAKAFPDGLANVTTCKQAACLRPAVNI
jgi:hypothetical protein